MSDDFETVKHALMDRYGYSESGDEPWDALARIEAELARLRRERNDEMFYKLGDEYGWSLKPRRDQRVDRL